MGIVVNWAMVSVVVLSPGIADAYSNVGGAGAAPLRPRPALMRATGQVPDATGRLIDPRGRGQAPKPANHPALHRSLGH